MRNRIWTVIAVVVIGLMPTLHCVADEPENTLLQIAVDELNEELAAFPFDEVSFRTRALTDAERPDKLKMDDVLTAIREWNRDDQPIDDKAFRIFQNIAKTQKLPPRSELYFRVSWQHPEPDDGMEYREVRFQLDVMTGEKTGYGFAITKQRLDKRRWLELTPNFSWIVRPYLVKPGNRTSNGVVHTVLDDPKSVLHVIASLLLSDNSIDLNGVAFDKQGNRYDLERDVIGQHSNMAMFRFLLNSGKTSPDAIEYFAIEGLTQSGIQNISQKAVVRAASKGIGVLPLPIVGETLKFSLAASDGRVIESSDMLGKVVLIDCWATWCGPCIRQFPHLKELYDEHRSEGFSIIGLSIDENPKAAVKMFESMKFDWPLITVPEDDDARELWEEAARIQSVPRVIILDKDGIVRFVGDEVPEEAILLLLEDANTRSPELQQTSDK